MSFLGKGGLFGGSGEILFFIILFLLLFYCSGGLSGFGYCADTAQE